MKKILLSGLALFVAFGAMAQSSRLKNGRMVEPLNRSKKTNVEVTVSPKAAAPVKHVSLARNASSTVSVVNIGGMPNANGVAFNARRPLFADPNINTVGMVFRNQAATMGGTSGQLRYSFSTDGGANWGTTNALIYDASGAAAPPFANARYPQGAIYNPTGNTNPSNAFFSFFAPDLGNVAPGACNTFGGRVDGSISLGGGTATKHEDLTNTENYIMDDMALNQGDNSLWVSQGLYDMSGAVCDYVDSMIFWKGVWGAGDYTYSTVKVPAAMEFRDDGSKMWDATRMAWSPNGQVGYAVNLGHESWTDVPDSVSYPIVFKTADAGANWTRVAALDMTSMDSLFGIGLPWKMADMGLSVDMNNNLHIFGIMVPGGSTYTSFYLVPVLADVVTSDQGNTWNANIIAMPGDGGYGVFDNSFGEFNRPQIARTADGSKMFMTWFETDTLIFGSADGNIYPDMWACGLDVATGLYGDSLNLTLGTDAEGACAFGVVSPLVLDGSAAGCYQIPAAYVHSPTNGPTTGSLDVNYIAGAEICGPFTKSLFSTAIVNMAAVGIHENTNAASFTVSQNYPNPFSGSTRLDITVKNSCTGSIDIYNVLGKVAKSIQLGTLSTGVNTVTIDGTDLASGIYTYTVKIGNDQVTHNLMVK